jgi:hypothetical protein
MTHTADYDARPTHVVYRITSEFSYEETPCSCSADHSHPVSDTRIIPPGVTS